MTIWSASLPQYVLESGVSDAPGELTIESQVDIGPPKVRKRFTMVYRELACTIACTQAQALEFAAFYRTVGTGLFIWRHPWTQYKAEFRFRKPAPRPQPFGSANVQYQLSLYLTRFLAENTFDSSVITWDSELITFDEDAPEL